MAMPSRTLFALVLLVCGATRAFLLPSSSAPRASANVVGRGGAHTNVAQRCIASVDGKSLEDQLAESATAQSRFAECVRKLEEVDQEILEAKAQLKASPDSETKERRLVVLEERKNSFEREKLNILKLEKEEEKEEKAEKKTVLRSEEKSFVFYDPDDPDGAATYTVRRNDWDRFFYSVAQRALRDVEDADARPVLAWDDIVDGNEYTVRGLGSLSERIERQETTNANRVKADEEAMGTMLATFLEECYGDIVAVPPARKIYKWPTANAATRWSGLIASWMNAASKEERSKVEKEMGDLKTEAGIPTEHGKDTGKVVIEYDAVAFSKDGKVVAVGEAKSTPGVTGWKKFVQKVQDTKDEAARGDPAFGMFRGKLTLPVFYGAHLVPGKSFWEKRAKKDGVVMLTRNGKEMHHVLNRNFDEEDICTFLGKYLEQDLVHESSHFADDNLESEPPAPTAPHNPT
mmetsp:Transcript_2738/g.9197  ORF Transcript_2738/g.9197 Transcript_2738/m.9197 type:complete len:461 (-) Transcript_2738:324-1706(-)